VLLLGAVLWTALEYLKPRNAMSGGQAAPLKRMALIFVGLVYVQMLLGALVAGLNAGLVYNTWPSMNGQFFPEGAFFHAPWWINFFENDGLVQFDHRIGAYLVTLAAITLFTMSRRTRLAGAARTSNTAVLHMTLLQVAIGIVTLLHQAPLLLAVAHQLAAVLLFCIAIWNLFETSRGQPVFARA
jgi:cytochrome c oxidase assembly protein subunit 15